LRAGFDCIMWQALRTFFTRGRAIDGASGPGSAGPIRDAPIGSSRIGIVALLASDWDRQLLSRMAADQGWAVYFAATCSEAWDLLNRQEAPIVLCDRDLPGAEWRDVIQKMASAPRPVYAVLLSKVADNYLWNEVIQRGGHDLIATPLREEQVLRAIRLAWSYWSNSMRVPPLAKHYL